MLKKLVLLVALVLGGALTPTGVSVGATPPAVEPPEAFFAPSQLGTTTFAPAATFRIDPGGANLPEAQGPENRTWDVQVVRADMRAANPPAWRTGLSGTTQRYHSVPVAPGQVVCVRARQHSWGVVSTWSRISCKVRVREDQVLPRKGPVKVVTDRHYPDRRASVLPRGTSLVISGIPAGALYGPAYTKYPAGPTGVVCTPPSWKIAGRPESDEARGYAAGPLHVMLHRTTAPGTAVVWTPFPRRCTIGGFVVLPRWVPR